MFTSDEILMMVNNAVKVAQVACSDTTTWFLTKSGELYGCGSGSYGAQGSGSTDDVTTFTKRP